MTGKTQNKKRNIDYLSTIKQLIKEERTALITGSILLFISTFIFISLISFLFSGDGDYSKVAHKSLGELLLKKHIVNNVMGAFGAIIAEQLINKWYGISSFAIPIFIAILGLRLMKVHRQSIIRWFLILSYFLVVGSAISAFLTLLIPGNSHIHWGGTYGQQSINFLIVAIGHIGTFLLLMLLLGIFFITFRWISVDSFRKKNPLSEKFVEESTPPTNPATPKRWWKWWCQKKKDGTIDSESPSSSADQTPTPLHQEETTTTQDPAFSPQEETSSKNESIEEHFEASNPPMPDDNFEIIVPGDDSPSETDTSSALIASSPETLQEEPESEFTEEIEEYDPTLELSSFTHPSTDLLKYYEPSGKGVDMAEQKENKERIITTLRHYGIEITSIKATVGPTITLYEIVPQAGVRISKIRNLEDDIALSLSALGIRIIAPMPGKGTIGIEVPNKDPQIVSMQSVIASKKFQECQYDLPVALGKTITNDIFMFDLCKMPHLLVAGATGQGKSVGLNAIITSLLYKKHPAEMKMVLVDPKMVEFNIYSTIERHYLAKLPDAEKAIITDVTKVTQTLNSLTKEMDDRYELLMGANVRTIKEYNDKFKKRKLNPLKGHRFLPYIVVIIDEFGDLIMTAGKEIEMPIARIAQKARAVGIHMIIATQRPTTNIITGTIKANFPARMAFRVTSQIDSRTILDMSGANQLIGRGDLLFSQGADLVRIQCAFVDTPEVEGIAQYIGNQQGYAHAFELPEFIPEGTDSKPGDVDLSDRDGLFEEVARLIVIHQQGSTSLIQRKFAIGYNRAGRLMDQLERAGIVGPGQGSKPREVLVADEYHLEQILNQMQ